MAVYLIDMMRLHLKGPENACIVTIYALVAGKTLTLNILYVSDVL